MTNNGVQSMPMRSIYPFTSGPTLGQSATGPSPYAGPQAGSQKAPENAGATNGVDEWTERAIAVGSKGNPLPFLVLMLVLVIALGYGAKKLPGVDAGEFKDLRISAYNIVITSLMAIVGIVFLKVLTTRFPIPGLTTLMHAV